MTLSLLIRSILLCVLCVALTACPGNKEPDGGYYKINTFVTNDSAGYKVGKGTAFSTVYIADPSGLSELCKKNYAVWISMVLQVDPTSDKEAVKSLAAAYVRKEALKRQSEFINNKEELDASIVREVYTRTGIRKIFEDKDYITFLKEDTVFGGDQNKSHITVGYTFTKADFMLADLIDSAEVDNYRRQITEQLGKTLVKHPDQLLDYLLIEDDCRKQGMVPLPANGAFLQDDSLVFIYQEYEIAPYKAGRPCVKLPFKRKPVAKASTTIPADSDSLQAGPDSLKTKPENTKSEAKQSKSKSDKSKSEAKKSKSDSKKSKSDTKQSKPKSDKSKSEAKKSKPSKKSSKSEQKSKKSNQKSSKSKKSDKKSSKK